MSHTDVLQFFSFLQLKPQEIAKLSLNSTQSQSQLNLRLRLALFPADPPTHPATHPATRDSSV